jgi:hypothetical protein
MNVVSAAISDPDHELRLVVVPIDAGSDALALIPEDPGLTRDSVVQLG